jgi:hypothetical protein
VMMGGLRSIGGNSFLHTNAVNVSMGRTSNHRHIATAASILLEYALQQQQTPVRTVSSRVISLTHLAVFNVFLKQSRRLVDGYTPVNFPVFGRILDSLRHSMPNTSDRGMHRRDLPSGFPCVK